eukprot:282488-Pyramimonas_sp.AAC.1
MAIMTERLIDPMYSHKTARNLASVARLSVHAIMDKGARIYVQSPKNGPEWDHVIRPATMNIDDTIVIQDIKTQDRPIG